MHLGLVMNISILATLTNYITWTYIIIQIGELDLNSTTKFWSMTDHSLLSML